MNKEQLKVSRRWFISSSTLCLLAGCGENRLAQTIADAYKLSLDQKGPPISRKTVNNLPYASISAKIGKGPRGFLILWRKENDSLIWLSADNATIVTKNGRITKTAGLPEEIMNTYHFSADPISLGLHKRENLVKFNREIDLKLNGKKPKTIILNSNFISLGPKTIKIVEIEFKTILIKEICEAKNINWKFENYYWVDPYDGIIWKSIQHIAQTFPSITLETLKPSS